MLQTDPSLPLEVLRLFRVIFKSASKHFEEIEKSVGLSGAQLWALSEIAAVPSITVSQLAAAMSLHQSTVSNLIDKMEGKGFVQRVRADHDRRVVKVCVSEQGAQALAQAPGPVKGILPDALLRMDISELQTLQGSLQSLVTKLDRKSQLAADEPLGTPIDKTI